MKEIALTRDKVALVDDEDYDLLMRWKWHYYPPYKGASGGVAKRNDGYTSVYMHRVIMNAPKGMEIDHIDFNGLNNQKINLRLCTVAENMMHRQIQRNNTSGYKGVFWRGNINKWQAQIKAYGRQIYLGCFSNVIDAAKKYNEMAVFYFGERAVLNNIEEPACLEGTQ